MLLRVVVDGVLVASENVHRIPADPQSGPGDSPFINSVADCSIGRSRAFGSHIAFCSESSHEIVAGRQSGSDRSLRHRLLHGLQVLRAGMEKKMDVGINQSGL